MSPPDPHNLNDAAAAFEPPTSLAMSAPAGTLAQPSVLSSAPTPLLLLQAFCRRWVLAVLLGILLGAVGAVAMWFLSPPTSRARTLVHVAANRPFMLFDTPDGKTDFTNYQRTQIAVIKSRDLLGRVLKENEIANLSMIKEQADPENWLEKNILVDFSVAPEILSISLGGDRPEEMKAIVNAVREIYIRESLGVENKRRAGRLGELQKIWTDYDGIQHEKVAQLKKMEEDLGSGNAKIIELKHELALKQLHGIQNELLQLQTRIREAQIEMTAFPNPELNISPEAMEKALAEHPELQRIQVEIFQLRTRHDEYRNRYKDPDNNPKVLEAVASLKKSQQRLQEKREEIRLEIEKSAKDQFGRDGVKYAESQKRNVQMMTTLAKTLEDELSRRAADIQHLGKKTVDVEWLKEELAYAKEISKLAGKQKEALSVEVKAELPPRLAKMEDGRITQVRDTQAQIKTAGMAGFGLFALGILAVSVLEFRARRVSGVQDIVHGLGLRLVGAIPLIPPRGLRADASTDKETRSWQHMLNESIDAIRTLILHSARHTPLQTLMVTSSSSGEGKSLISSHLATSLARAGLKCLLIDGDLRKPSLHHVLNQGLKPGFAELIRGETSIKDAVQATPVPGLSFMPAGEWNRLVIGGLAQQSLGTILDKLKCQFDFIIIDSAPVLAVADSLTIGQLVDAVIISVLRNVSRLPVVFAAYERLAMLKIRILGAVVGGTDSEAYGSSYHYFNLPPVKPLIAQP